MSLVRIPRKIVVPQKQTHTVTVDISGFDSAHSSYASVSSNHPISEGYAGSESGTYAQFTMATGSYAEMTLYYTFDLPAIPAGATIKSVTCTAKIYLSSTSGISTRTAQLCTGTTVKGSASNITNSTTAFSMTPGDDWTRAELLNAGIKVYTRRSTSSTSNARTVRFYGATLTVEYESY